MDHFKFINLASSSSGNCYYLELDRDNEFKPFKLILEAGISWKDFIKKTVENHINASEIDACVITHNHMDHVRGAIDMLKRGFKVYGNKYITIDKYRLNANETKYIGANIAITPFEVMHDAPDSLGFVIMTPKLKILFVNDCKYFKADLSTIKFDYVFIEANHDGQVLHYAKMDAVAKNDKPNIKRYERLLDSHMSIANTIKTLKTLDLSECKAIFLMHLSDRHANENIFKARVKEELKINCFVCKKNGGIL